MKKWMIVLVVTLLLMTGILTVSATAVDSMASGNCGVDGDNITWTLDSNGILSIIGSGRMDSFQIVGLSNLSSTAPWYSQKSKIKVVEIQGSITNIGSYAFFDCNSFPSVTIPDGVTNIGEGAFANCSGLTSVTIPDSVTTIEESAFASCSGLTSVTIPDSVITIEESAFFRCSALTSIIIPDGVTRVRNSAFASCSGLTSVTIPDSVFSIESRAFEDCSGLTSVIIGNNVTSIGDFAFFSCSALTSVIIPDSVISIGEGAFQSCNGLTSVTIGNNVTVLAYDAFLFCNDLLDIDIGIGNSIYSSLNGVVFDYNHTTLVIYPSGRSGHYAIPNGVTNIGAFAFQYCSGLTSVTIPNSVASIGEDAFAGCSRLTSVNIPNSVTSIGNFAFDDSGLTNITIPNSVTSIGKYTFSGCDNLKNISIPSSITNIGDHAFYGCSGLKSVTIFYGTTYIGDQAFAYCRNLKSVYMPESVTAIGYRAFSYCDALTDIYYSGSQKQWNAIITDYYREGVKYAAIHYNSPNPGKVNTPTETNVPAERLTIMGQSSITVGYQTKLTAFVEPVRATRKVVTWSSSDNSVATVDKNGWVTGKSAGNAMITASSDGKTFGFLITVKSNSYYPDFTYSFFNTRSDFGYSKTYKIPKERYLQIGFSKSDAKSAAKNYSWNGNCFGMSMSSILFYKNIMEEEKYVSTVHKPIDFDAPDTNLRGEKKLRQMIELLQVLTYRIIGDWIEFSPASVASELDRGNFICLGLRSTTNEDHTVVIYQYRKSENVYTFDIYDCAGFVNRLTYTNEDNYSFHYTNPLYTWNPIVYFPPDRLESLYNSLKTANNQNAASLLSDEGTSVMLFCPAENMTITNANGQTDLIVDGELTGNIDGIQLILSSYLAEEPTYTIIAPADTYTITGPATVSAADDTMSVDVMAKESAPVTISADLRNISIVAVENDAYSVMYTTYDNAYDEMTLSGTAYGDFSASWEVGQIRVSGAKTIRAEATVSEEPVSVEVALEVGVNATVRCSDDKKIQILSGDTPLTESVALAGRVQAPTPSYDLTSGTYAEGQYLTFTKDEETLVYYTTDGTAPTAENGFLYTLPIEINHSMTVKAIASKYGYADSEVVELTYTLPGVTAPTSNYSSGHYDQPLYVDLYAEDDTEIYYTTDGSNPLTDGIPFGASIVLTTDTTITACAVKNGCVSDVVAYIYMISPESTLMLSNTPVNQNNEVITAENLADLSKVTLVVENLSSNAQNGIFMVAFYKENGRFISVDSQIATINREGNVVEVGITGDVSAASRMKVFILDSAYRPLSEATVVSFNSEN